MKPFKSLESRICMLIIGLIFSLLFAIGHMQIKGQRESLVAEKTKKYESLSKMLALNLKPVDKIDDWNSYRDFTTSFMEKDLDISYIIITDSKNRVLFADTRDLTPRQHENFIGRQSARLVAFVNQLTTLDEIGSVKISIPAMVTEDERGAITLGFSSHSMAMAAESMETQVIATFAMAFLIGIFASLLLAKAITHPLKRLIRATHAVESGNLDVRVPVSSQDEIGELSDGFNRMVSALKESTVKLIERANTDSLTGLSNHRYFQERLRSEMKRAERYGRPISVIMLDLDHFKALNDTHGHPVGDGILQEVAGLLSLEGRKDIDVITRYGGEEFALILPETDIEGAMQVAERIRVGIQRNVFKGKNDEIIPVTASLGISQYPLHSSEPEGLIMAADLAMYQSKSMGRNQSTAFSGENKQVKNRDPYKLYLLLHASDMSTIEAMASAVDTKSQRPQGFSKLVVADAMKVAREMGLSDKEQKDVQIASYLHDIGKLGISEEILNKKGKLTEEEFSIIRSHPALGHAVIQKSPHLKSMLPGILSHHEWWDGSGYPDSLKGEEIPLIARIISVVDAYHAMLTERPHCPPRSLQDAKDEMKRFAGHQFDPNVVEVFLKVLEQDDEAQQKKAA